MGFLRKRNWIEKAWLKYANRPAYDKYKAELRYLQEYERTCEPINQFILQNNDLTVNEILANARDSSTINILHSGNAGDVIYSLPVVKELSGMTNKPLNYLLKLDEPLNLPPGQTHPLGQVMLNQETTDRLLPLILAQRYIGDAAVYRDQHIHLDLSLFRQSGLDLTKGNIARWNFYTTGINADLSKPWLCTRPDTEFSDSIVLARSSRYNNPFINHRFLSDYHNLVFLGVKQEYEKMKKSVRNLHWHPVKNFLELAAVISGSRLFIGNQSFPYAVAEGLKAIRLLEVNYQIPNVIPEGPDGYDFYFQKHFEYLVDSLMRERNHLT